MARMRSLKPEFWHDQEITRLPRDARLLYMAMWNLADEHSRLQGDPRYVKGQAFPYDDDLPATAVESLIDELVTAGRAVRYQVRGAVYLYLPKLAKHQRLDTEKVASRLPDPSDCEVVHNQSEKNPDESEKNPDVILPSEPSPTNTGPVDKSGYFPDESGSGANLSALSMLQVAGGREHVAGSMEHVSATPIAAQTGIALLGSTVTAQTIIGEWLEHVTKRPPGNVIGQAAKVINQMLSEGIDPDDIRRGMAAWVIKGAHPSSLPSFVNEAMNAKPRVSRRQQETDDMFARAAVRLGVTPA